MNSYPNMNRYMVLNRYSVGYPVPSISSEFLPQFNTFDNVNAMVPLRPNFPTISPGYIIPNKNHRFPSGVSNFDQSAIRQFTPYYY